MILNIFNTRYLYGKAVLFSLLLHGAVISNLAIVFPKMAPSPNPGFIFLGSILHASDMGENLSQMKSSENNLSQLTTFQDRNSLYSGEVEKPTRTTKLDPQNKKTLKHGEAPQNPPVEQAPRPVNQYNEIETTIEPYKPLRLKDYDHN